MGRKSKYAEFCEPHIKEIQKWVSAGATDEEIAKALGISLTTIYEYKKKYPKFSQAFVRGREVVIIEIKSALLKKALGFNYEEEKRVGKKDAKGENVVLVEKYTRYCPPSETAAAMLLRNYDKDWRDSDNTSVEFRKQEAELREAIARSNNFDLGLDDIKEN